VHSRSGFDSPPPAPREAPIPKPSLLHALCHNSLAEVLVILAQCPEAAGMPFADHHSEPPLCSAIRLKCGIEIVETLLNHMADFHAINIHNHTPLEVLSSIPDPASDPERIELQSLLHPCFFAAPHLGFSEFLAGCTHKEWSLKVATLLMGRGADPLSNGNGNLVSCIDLARSNRNAHLVELFLGQPHR